jgi:hypothetical protein
MSVDITALDLLPEEAHQTNELGYQARCAHTDDLCNPAWSTFRTD